MRYMATIYISDVMESVALTLEVQGWERQWGPPEQVLSKTFVWPGVGEGEPSVWLQRALRGCLASMKTTPGESLPGAAAIGGPYTISGSSDTLL